MKRLIAVYSNLLHLLEMVKKEGLIALVLQLFRGLTEGVGLLFIIPLLSIAGVSQLETSNSQLVQFIHRLFENIGLSISVVNVLIVYLLIMIFYALLNYVQSVNSVKINQRVVLKWRSLFFEKITNASWSSIQKQKNSDLQEILTIEIKRFSAISNQSIQLIGSIILIIVYLALSSLLSIQLTLLSILPMILLVFLNKPINKRTYSLGQTAVKHNKAMHSVILEHLNSLKLVKSYQKEKEHLNNFQDKSHASERQTVEFIKTSGKTKLFFEILAALVIVLYIYVAIAVLDIPITEVLLLIFIFARLLPKVSKVVSGFQQILNNLPSFETTLTAIEKLKEEKKDFSNKTVPHLKNEIELNNLSFSYENKEVLNKLNFSIHANKTTLILGSSGAGKSTLIDLIIGMQQASMGTIHIDGIPIEEINQKVWKSQIAIVPQDAFLFHESIKDNLLWAKPDASTENINNALVQAGAFEFIQQLPNGLNTLVGDRGTSLSGGERQRIALARALIRKPQLLILDEATSAVDDNSENIIKKALSQLSGNLTIIIVAHRSKLVELADDVIRLS